jgi:hypothetical protein
MRCGNNLKYTRDFLHLARVALAESPFRVTLKFGRSLPPPGKGSAARRAYTAQLRETIGRLVAPYPTQLLATVAEEGMSRHQLVAAVNREYNRWQSLGIDISNIPRNPVAIIGQASRQFRTPIRTVMRKWEGKLCIDRPDILQQYRNHVAHLLPN